jgi:hypothetical protein
MIPTNEIGYFECRIVALLKAIQAMLDTHIRDHFTAFVGMQSRAASTDSWNVELWPDPVETQALLQQISAKIRKCIVLRPEAVIATALWTMTAWAHEGAAHSPILAAISVEPDSGKSTLLGVLRFLVPKPFVSVELSASNRPVPAYTVRLIANTRPSRETKAWLAAQPEGRFQFTFTPKHGSWLNLIEAISIATGSLAGNVCSSASSSSQSRWASRREDGLCALCSIGMT